MSPNRGTGGFVTFLGGDGKMITTDAGGITFAGGKALSRDQRNSPD